MHYGLFLNQSYAASVGGLGWLELEYTFSSDPISDSISQWLKTMKIKDFLCFVFISVPQTKMWTETQESFKIICNRSCFPRKRLAIPVLLSDIYFYVMNRCQSTRHLLHAIINKTHWNNKLRFDLLRWQGMDRDKSWKKASQNFSCFIYVFVLFARL